MANDICSWLSDGIGGETLEESVRIKRVDEIPKLVEQMKDKGVVRITKERTGSEGYTNLWISPSYTDPFLIQ